MSALLIGSMMLRTARGATLTAPVILDRILVSLVDVDRRPPGKARPRTVAQLADPGLDPASVTEVLAVLADREIVRCAGDPSDKGTPWQLDHDYLARPILRLKAEQEKWAILLTERATAFRDAGLSLSRRWRSLLSLWQQIGVLIARLRGRLRYGTATGVALASLTASIVSITTASVAVGGMGWAAWQYNDAVRIEAMVTESQKKIDNKIAEWLRLPRESPTRQYSANTAFYADIDGDLRALQTRALAQRNKDTAAIIESIQNSMLAIEKLHRQAGTISPAALGAVENQLDFQFQQLITLNRR